MHATVASFNPDTHAGTVLLDDGVELAFGAAAFDAGGLLTLRLGQRVQLVLAEPEPEGQPSLMSSIPPIVALTVATLPAP